MEPRFIAAQCMQRGGGTPPAAPSITSVDPDTSGLDEAVSAVFTGTGFTGATSISMHFSDDGHGDPIDKAISEYTVVSDTEIDATFPEFSPAIPEASYITITGPGGSDTIPFTTT